MDETQKGNDVPPSSHDEDETVDGTNRADSPKTADEQPYRVNMPGFIQEDVGLGDVIKRVTYAVGIKPCGGCQRRAAALNRWLVFSPRR